MATQVRYREEGILSHSFKAKETSRSSLTLQFSSRISPVKPLKLEEPSVFNGLKQTSYPLKSRVETTAPKDTSKVTRVAERLKKFKSPFELIATSPFYLSQSETESAASFEKPILPEPFVSVFATYYLLDKLGIEAESVSYAVDKQNLDANNKRFEEARKKKLEMLKETLKKEESSKNWSIAMKVFSWMASFMILLTGVVLVATGVGAVGGALLIAAGTIQITNQIMQETGAWKKIADLLPGNDIEKKGMIASWMQLGVMILSIILSGAAAIFGGGLNALREGAQSAFSLFLAGLAISKGVVGLGNGITQNIYLSHMGDVKIHHGVISKLKFTRHDLVERVRHATERLKDVYESMALNLELRQDVEQVISQRFR